MFTDPYQTTSGRLRDKIAIVVGAGQTPGPSIGNGRATALVFAHEGARVVAVDRDEESVRETCDLIEQSGGIAHPLVADITNPSDVEAIAQGTLEAFGQIDILHNNVGIGTGDGPALKVSEADWDRIQNVNVHAPWAICRQVIPHMRERRTGVITNISSIAAVASAPNVAYKVSKAGLNALTHALVMENAAFGIRVNAIMPGLIDTSMGVGTSAANSGIDEVTLRDQRNRSVPLNQRMGRAWDVAYAALFLASDEASFITGAILPVDGGHSSRIG
ncbi:SDR family NAD(P)-dependent oxidoreductase [Streptomyces sp. NPDC056390]|uniref:SDR family NAD(P)-dependent oxidoreductase n=1 Tax=Streptomyces sp. NPDC056390 TaxID=3345806 RepID=UPI0035E18016